MINFDDFMPSTDNKNSDQNDQKNDTNFNDNNFTDMNNMLGNMTLSNPQKDEEEKIRMENRQKEADERKQKIAKKIELEEKLRLEIRQKASEYLLEFEKKRQEEIANKRKQLEEKEFSGNKENDDTKGTSESWSKVSGNIDLKDSEYKGSKDVQRMREAMLNRQKDPNSEPLEKFFG